MLLTTEAGLTRSALLEAARRFGMSELAVPRQIYVVDMIPLLGTGKVDYPSVRAQAIHLSGKTE